MMRDEHELLTPRTRSATNIVLPVSVAIVLIANTAYVGMRFGGREEKLDMVITSMREIKAEMYRRRDADKDRELIDLKIEDLTRRVEALEASRSGKR